MGKQEEDRKAARRELVDTIIDEGLWDYPEELEKRLCDAFPDERVEVYRDGEKVVVEVSGYRTEVPSERLLEQPLARRGA